MTTSLMPTSNHLSQPFEEHKRTAVGNVDFSVFWPTRSSLAAINFEDVQSALFYGAEPPHVLEDNYPVVAPVISCFRAIKNQTVMRYVNFENLAYTTFSFVTISPDELVHRQNPPRNEDTEPMSAEVLVAMFDELFESNTQEEFRVAADPDDYPIN